VIITMKNTETREISAKIDELHEERGEAALGRVLTLLISTNETSLEHDLAVANNASREHPCRVIAIAPNSRRVDAAADDGKPHTFLDAEVRFGSDAGAGEIIVLRPIGGLVHHPDTLVIPLLVPDAPVVAWWPNEAPANLSNDLLGSMARSRITDAMHSSNPMRTMDDLRRNWSSKNVDMSWTRLTVWRAMLASMLDQPPHLLVSGVPEGFPSIEPAGRMASSSLECARCGGRRSGRNRRDRRVSDPFRWRAEFGTPIHRRWHRRIERSRAVPANHERSRTNHRGMPERGIGSTGSGRNLCRSRNPRLGSYQFEALNRILGTIRNIHGRTHHRCISQSSDFG